MTDAPSRSGVDWRVAAIGALVAAFFAVPAAIVGRLVEPGSALGLLANGAILFGLATGGYAAAQRRPDLRFAHGALAGFLAYVGVQTVGALTTLARGDELRVWGYPILAMIATSCGLFGAFIAGTRQRRLDREV